MVSQPPFVEEFLDGSPDEFGYRHVGTLRQGFEGLDKRLR